MIIRKSTNGGCSKPKDLATATKSSLLISKIFFNEWESYARTYALYASFALKFKK